MAGLMPRRRAVDRLASAASRRAPVGLGTPGIRQVYRRDRPQTEGGGINWMYFEQNQYLLAADSPAQTGVSATTYSNIKFGVYSTSWFSIASTGTITILQTGLYQFSFALFLDVLDTAAVDVKVVQGQSYDDHWSVPRSNLVSGTANQRIFHRQWTTPYEAGVWDLFQLSIRANASWTVNAISNGAITPVIFP